MRLLVTHSSINAIILNMRRVIEKKYLFFFFSFFLRKKSYLF